MALLKSGTRIYGNATVDTNLSIDGTTVSSSYQSGALVVKGGVGIAGNVFIDANLNAKDTLISGNLTVTGTTTTVNSTTTQLQDPIIDVGGGANGAALTTDDGLARGLALNYYNVSAKTAFLGFDNANGRFAFGSNVSNTTGTLVINAYGDVKANSFVGNLVGTANLSQIEVNGISRFGNVGNVRITGGADGYILKTDGQGNLTWVTPSTTSAAGSNTQVQYNNSSAFGSSANFTFDSSSNTLTVDKITANGAGLTSITGANVTGNVANATYALNAGNAYNVTGSNVSGQVSNALISGTVYTNSQPNITSVGTLSGLSIGGNIIPSANITYDLGNNTNRFKDLYLSGNTIYLGNANITAFESGDISFTGKLTGDAGGLSNIVGGNVTGTVANALIAGTVYTNAQPNITSVGALSNLTVGNATSNVIIANGNITTSGGLDVTGNISAGNISATYINANLAYATGLAGASGPAASYVTSNISTVVAGSTIAVVADYANASYPGGVFTIAQLGPVSLTATDVWASGSSTKNAYSNSQAGIVNTQNVNITLGLSNATFSVQSSDSITIGGSAVTGANLVSLNITGNGTYTIPNTFFSSARQTATTSTVSISLTTSRGLYTASGTTLTATQAIPFTLNALTGSFPSASVPYFNLNQSFNWNASVTGTVSAGNITYSGGVVSTTNLTSVGATSGSSGSVDSTSSYTITSSDLYGAGLYGYGSRTIPSTVNGTVSAATKYYPVFYKTTANSTIPTLTTSDTYLTRNYVLGDGATTSLYPNEYLWIAIPGTSSHTFAYTFLGSPVGQNPAVTSSQTISGYSYNIYGFTNFSVATALYTVT